MRQYTLDGIELALKAIEHRKDCKTAAGIIRQMITTERIRKGKHNRIDILKDVRFIGTKETWFNKLMKRIGL
jgi:hypothetical protein